MLSYIIGRGAIKAWFGGLGAAGATLLAPVLASCDFESIGQQLGGAAGAAIIGYIVTWLAPKNR